MSEKFQDKYRIPSARLRNWDYSAEGIYFITICAAGHECYFGRVVNKKMILSDIGSLVQFEWEKSFVIRAELFCDYFIIMPNHIHAILRIENGICKQTDDNSHDLFLNDVETDGRPSLQLPNRPPIQISNRPPIQISNRPSEIQNHLSEQTSNSNIIMHFETNSRPSLQYNQHHNHSSQYYPFIFARIC